MINKERLGELAGENGIALTGDMLDQFDRYAALLIDWNSRMNLTAITDPDEIMTKHFLDSLLLLAAVDVPNGVSLIDVGTGAGFPGVPLMIARPDLKVTLLDSLNKRVDFLREASARLGLVLTCIHSRAEDLAREPSHRERYGLATARAVAALPVLAEYGLPFVRVGGRFVAMKGKEVEAEAAASTRAVAALGGKLSATQQRSLPGGEQRSFVVIEKISQTPAKYPRTAGKPQKSPL